MSTINIALFYFNVILTALIIFVVVRMLKYDADDNSDSRELILESIAFISIVMLMFAMNIISYVVMYV